jgi:hypothetical protein
LEKYLLPGLVANASTLGIHWIYDHTYLKKLAKTQSLFFLIQNKARYAEARNAYYSYPGHEKGDVTVQGKILLWAYQALKEKPSLSQEEYSKLLYEQFRPGGTYRGYVETYAKKHVLSILAKSLGISVAEFPLMDDHLVGFMPYLACKELSLPNEKAWELAQLYTKNEDYPTYYNMFDALFEALPTLGLREALRSVLPLAPKHRQEALRMALEIENADAFVDAHAGRACAIQDSVPVIFHVLSHAKSFEDGILSNALIGGAVSDRNTLIGAILGQVFPVPEEWSKIVRTRHPIE